GRVVRGTAARRQAVPASKRRGVPCRDGGGPASRHARQLSAFRRTAASGWPVSVHAGFVSRGSCRARTSVRSRIEKNERFSLRAEMPSHGNENSGGTQPGKR